MVSIEAKPLRRSQETLDGGNTVNHARRSSMSVTGILRQLSSDKGKSQRHKRRSILLGGRSRRYWQAYNENE
jgi:hypothetical protein